MPKPRLADVLLLFAVVFGINIRGGIDTAVVFELALFALWAANGLRLRPMVGGLALILFVCLQYAVLVYIVAGAVDLYYPLRFTRALIALIGTTTLLERVARKRRLAPHQLWAYFGDIYLVLMCIQTVVAFGEYLNPQFAQWMYVHWVNYPWERISEVRALGLTPAAALPSYLHVIGFYIAWYKLARGHTAFSRPVLCLLGVVSLSATFLMAQTGVVLLVVSIVPFAIFTLGGLPRVLFYFGTAAALIALTGAWYWDSRLTDDQKERVGATVDTKTDFVTNYFRYRYVGNSSFDYLRTMYMLPDSAAQMVFGNSLGLWSNDPLDPVDRRRMRSDIGYVVDIGGIGLVGLFLSLLFYGTVLTAALTPQPRRDRGSGRLVLAVMTIFFLIGHAKEVHLFARSGFELYIIVFWSALRLSGPLPARERPVATRHPGALSPAHAAQPARTAVAVAPAAAGRGSLAQ